MARGTYKGETQAKKAHRLALLERLHSWPWQRERPPQRWHVLASEFCGDISTLKGLGVGAGDIRAYELDQRAREIGRSQHPDVEFRGDVASEFDPIACGQDVVYLDFCSPLNSQTLKTIVEVAARMRTGGSGSWFAVTILKGREDRSLPRRSAVELGRVGSKGGLRKKHIEPRHIWRELLRRVLSGRDAETGGDYASCHRYIAEEYPDVPPAARRIGVITEALRLTTRFGSFYPVVFAEYSSGVSPMLTVAFRATKFDSPARLAGPRPPYTAFEDIVLLNGQWRPNGYGGSPPDELVAWRRARELSERDNPFIDTDHIIDRLPVHEFGALRAAAAADRGRDWPRLLNVSRGTVAAWRAAETRSARDATRQRLGLPPPEPSPETDRCAT